MTTAFSTPEILHNVPMSTLSTYRIGGRVSHLATPPARADELCALLEMAKNEELPWAVIGNGSNILMPDEDLKALLIKIKPQDILWQNGEITVSAGTNNNDLATFAAARGLQGFGFIYDIPGTIGGAITQNAGMNDEDFSQLVKNVTHLAPDGQLFTTDKENLAFGYRQSAFKNIFKNHIIIKATLIPKGAADPQNLQREMEELKKTRWAKFPMEYGNCGSVFKRPSGYYAGKLIQDAGLSGYTVGGAQVSQKHRNFLVNLGNASARDVKNLIAHIQKTVLATSGIELERELLYLEDLLQR